MVTVEARPAVGSRRKPPVRSAVPAVGKDGMRIEIQALRAGSVLTIMGFHLWPGRFHGGFVAVDVFFVISGFLITGQLVREADRSGTIALGRFWARRARRLLPAAYAVLLATSVAVLVWLPAAQWTKNFREIVAATFYAENWLLAADSVDYLAAEASPSAVQQYWTLSVEEQFYLLWPLLILGTVILARRAGRDRQRLLLAAIAGSTAVGLAYSLYLSATHPEIAYFATTSRAWAFGAGAVLALVLHRIRLGRWAAAVSWAGIALIGLPIFLFDTSMAYPGTGALAPVVGTMLVIAAGAPAGRFAPTRLMALRPIQTTGEISYSLYLWHWPPIVLLPAILDRELGFWPRLSIVGIAFALAWLTVHLVENPARFGRRMRRLRPSTVGVLSVAGSIVVLAVAALGWNAGRTAEQDAARLTAVVNASMPECFGAGSMPPAGDCENPELATMRIPQGPDVARDFGGRSQCWAGNLDDQLKTCDFGNTADGSIPHVLLVGDSHARALLPAFVRLAEVGELSVTSQLKGSCAWSVDPPNSSVPAEAERTCPVWRDRVNAWVREHRDDIDLVVTTGYTKGLSGDADERAAGLSEAWRVATDAGIPVAAVVDNPSSREAPAECLDRHSTWDESTCAIDRSDAFAKGDPFGEAARRTPGATRIDMTDFYCDEDRCPAIIGGVNVYRDAHHFTTTFTRTLAPFLWQRISERVDLGR